MNFTIAVDEDGYVKNKEIVGILVAFFLLLLLFCTKEQPELIKVVLAIFFISLVIYIVPTLTRGNTFVYEKLLIVFLQVRDKYLQATDCQPACVFEIATLKNIVPEFLGDSMSVSMKTIESEAVAESSALIELDILSFIKPDPVHAVDLEHEPEALNSITVDGVTAIEPKTLEVTESESSLVIDPQIESLSLVGSITETTVEPEASIQCMSAVEGRAVSPEESDSSVSDYMEETFFVSCTEIRASLRVEAYLATEHAAAYLGLPVENFNKLARKKSLLPVKKCGSLYLYQINNLNSCTEKMSSYPWTQKINAASQEKIISEHGMLTTPKAAQYVGCSPDILPVWRKGLPKTIQADTQKRDVREGDVSSMVLDNSEIIKVFKWIPHYGPVVTRLFGSVFYDIADLDSWCDSPMASKRKPRTNAGLSQAVD